MRAIILIAILCVAAASRITRPTRPTKPTRPTIPFVPFKRIDKKCIVGFVSCYKKVMLNGNRLLGIPSHNPYVQPFSYNITKQIGPHLLEHWSALNLKWHGKADFTYKFVEIPTPIKEDSHFNFTIVWPKLRASGEWRRFADFYGFSHRDNGHINLELTNRVWKGDVRICRKGVKFQVHSTLLLLGW